MEEPKTPSTATATGALRPAADSPAGYDRIAYEAGPAKERGGRIAAANSSQ